jgi:U3 small nucleolar RNA-associated protein 7
MFAVAQKRWTHVYDRNGTELHCMKNMASVHSLEFLPRHFLLVGLNNTNYLTYLDVSTGKLVSACRIKQTETTCMSQNPSNAIILSGNCKGLCYSIMFQCISFLGVIGMWAPNQKEALVEMLAHKAPISGIAVHRQGVYMATISLDNRLK